MFKREQIFLRQISEKLTLKQSRRASSDNNDPKYVDAAPPSWAVFVFFYQTEP